MKEIKVRIIAPQCYFDCEMVVGPDVTLEEQEIRRIYDESIGMSTKGKYHWVSLSDFKNAEGQTIGEYLLDKHEDFAFALVKKTDLGDL
jgi:hypothetical protein